MARSPIRWQKRVWQWVRSSISSWQVLGTLFSAALLLSLVLNGCSAAQSSLQPLKIGITTWPGFDIVLYAQESGIFKKRGLQVELVRFENQQDSSRAVMRGALDAAFASLWDVLQVDSGNDKPAVVLVTNVSHGSDGIVTSSKLKQVEDLRNRRVGAKLGTVNHLILLEALKLHKVKPEDVTIQDVSNESAVQMLEKGKLDGAVVWQPLLGETARKIKGNIVFTTKELDSLVVDMLVSRSTTVKARKAELSQFVAAWLDVMHAVETRPDTVYELVGRQLNQSAKAFASDYAGLQKGDIAMQQRMFGGRLKDILQQMDQLLQQDSRAGRVSRGDIEISAELVTTAIEGWKP